MPKSPKSHAEKLREKAPTKERWEKKQKAEKEQIQKWRLSAPYITIQTSP